MTIFTEHNWATVGKVLTPIVAAGTIFVLGLQILDRFTGPSLVAGVALRQYDLHPGVGKVTDKLIADLKPEAIQKAIDKAYKDARMEEDAPTIPEDAIDLLSRRLTGSFGWLREEGLPHALIFSRQVAIIHVDNPGSKPVTEVVFSIPGDGSYLKRIGPVDTTPEVFDYEHSLELGTVRPGEHIRLTVFPNFFFPNPVDTWTINHSDGLGTIYEVHEFVGPGPDLVYKVGERAANMMLIGAAILLVFGTVLVHRWWLRRKESSQSDT